MKLSKDQITLIEGNKIFDDRGSVKFNNDFKFDNIKRFYIINNFNTSLIRAWHAHKKEEKFVMCIKGSIMIGAVKIMNFEDPDPKAKVFKKVLTSEKSEIIHIPKNFANGLKALEKKSELLIFSSSSLEESLNDDYRYPYNFWNIWEIENR